MIIKYLDKRTKSFGISVTQTGNSDAYHCPYNFDSLTVMLSGITGGEATVQFSLSNKDDVINDTGIWHNWYHNAVTETSGACAYSPLSYLRVISASAVRYTLEILG
jgi:hypothetical protein